MKVEIDQSGKLEQSQTDTIMAYSNGHKGILIVKSTIKQQIIKIMRYSPISQRDASMIWFAVVIFLLVKDLSKNTTLIIDKEYPGREKIIEKTLSKLLQEYYNNRWSGSIRFQKIGKTSPAHIIAWSLHRSKQKGKIRQLKKEEVLKLMGIKQ